MLRGVLLAVLAALLAAGGHRAAGGELPELPTLLILLPLLAGLCTAVAERTRSLFGLLAVLGFAQVGLHGLIDLLHSAHPVGDHSVGDHSVGAPATAGPPTVAMILGHAVATVLTAVAVRHADRALELLAALLRRVVPRRPVRFVVDRPCIVLVGPAPDEPTPTARALAACLQRRGPPVWC